MARAEKLPAPSETTASVIIIKKRSHGAHAHHGGAWKVAYADFVTAMMAFFLLLWLLNVTTDVQKLGIADYFAPENVSTSTSGTGGILGGTTLSSGAMPRSSAGFTLGLPASPTGQPENEEAPDKTDPPKEVNNPTVDAEDPPSGAADAGASGAGDQNVNGATATEIREALAKKEDQAFAKAEQTLRQEIQDVPELRPLQENVIIDHTPDGLRIQIVDQQKTEMFPTGSPVPDEEMRKLVDLVARVVAPLPNPVTITGHTDSLSYPAGAQYTNWELSIDRANAARRELIAAGLPRDHIEDVMGKADTEPLFQDNPADPRNRRISFILRRDVTLATPPAASAASTPAASRPTGQSL